MGCFLYLLYLVKTLLITEAIICVTALYELLGICLEHTHSLGLNVWSYRSSDIWTLIPLKSRKLKGVVNYIYCALYITLLIGILNSENKISAVFLCY